VIETERLVLRLPVPDDAEAVAEASGDSEVMRYIGNGETGTDEDAVRTVERMRRAWELDGFGGFIVVRREDGATLGRVGFMAWDPDVWRSGTRAEIGDRAEVELGWTLSRIAWGHGYATEAALAARDWGLAEIAMRRLISLIHPENVRSMRVATKIGERYRHDITTHRGIASQLWELEEPQAAA
jgi:RimJ/RimL family protein N-acetyltransferase